uniref:Immunoglobulin V-set domain-containing protein n=1 Tax=Esox lucius TaxID=8010 RepID=A0A6Q2YMH3_ESOLU
MICTSSHSVFISILYCRVSVLSSDWAVRVPSAPVCADAGSSVVLPCSYNFPEPYRVLSEMWCRDQSRCITPRYVYHSQGILPELAYQGRVEYLGKEGTRNCSLRISDLRMSDNGKYMFYFITNHPVEKPPEQIGVTLLVAGKTTVLLVHLAMHHIYSSVNNLLLMYVEVTESLRNKYLRNKSIFTTVSIQGYYTFKLQQFDSYE